MGEADELLEWTPVGAAAKLAYIQSEMGQVRKTGRHQQGYEYVQEHKLIEQLRPLLRKLHCAVVVEPAQQVDVRDAQVFGKPGFLVTLQGRIRFIDSDAPVDSPDREISAEMCGQGTDPGDKASGKAQTYLTKYAMQKLFLIPTDKIDDADASAPEARPAKAKPVGLLEFTRAAIRAREGSALPDAEWAKLVKSSTSRADKQQLLAALDETYTDLGGDVAALRAQHAELSRAAA